jgi:hypothetical protein
MLSRLLCTPLGRRLLCACGALELSEHLRRLMLTAPDTGLERGFSLNSPSSDVHAKLRQRLGRLDVPLGCRVVKRRCSMNILRLLVHAKLH